MKRGREGLNLLYHICKGSEANKTTTQEHAVNGEVI